jgi:hypothetical protein
MEGVGSWPRADPALPVASEMGGRFIGFGGSAIFTLILQSLVREGKHGRMFYVFVIFHRVI